MAIDLYAYVTTYCNQAHRIADGKPIQHECHVLPPAALAAELACDFETACELVSTMKRVAHRGCRK